MNEKFYDLIEKYKRIFFVFKRSIKHFYQRIIKGFPDSDTWSLDYTIAKFTLPILKRYKELNIGVPMEMSEEEWNKIIDMIIYAMESIIIDLEMKDGWENIIWEDVETGIQLFGDYFRDLWW